MRPPPLPEFDGDPEMVEIEVLIPQPPAVSAPPVPEPNSVKPEAAEADESGGPVQPDAGTYGESGDHAPTGSAVKEHAVQTGYDGAQPEAAPSAGSRPEPEGAMDSAKPPLSGVPGGPTVTPTTDASMATRPRGHVPGEGPVTTPPSGHPPETQPPIERIRPGEGRKIVVRNEIVYELGPDGHTLRTLSYRQYRDYAKNVLSELCHDAVELRARWVHQEQREEIRARLEDAGVDLGELATALHQPEADPLDLLLHVAFGGPLLTRCERAERLRQDHPDFFARYNSAAREILQTILTKYVQGEAPDVGDPDLLRVPPLLERGTFMELARPFGGGAGVRAALKQMQALLYTA